MINISFTVIKRSGEEISFDTSKIVEAVSKASIRAEEEKVDRQLKLIDLFAGVGGLRFANDEIDKIVNEILDEILYNYEREKYGAAGLSYLPYHIYRELMRTRERLEKRREELRTIRRRKTESVTAMIKRAWQNRNRSVGRSSTSAVSDKMLLSIPTPPTAVAANRSLWRGGVVVANMG